MSRPHRTRTIVLGVLMLLSLVATSCGSSGADDLATTVSDATADASAAANEPSGPTLDASVLDGSATTVNGETFNLGDLAGTDLVVWFWAPW